MKNTKTITIKWDAMTMKALPRLIPQKIAEFARDFGLVDACGRYDEATKTAIMTCTDDIGDPTANRSAIVNLARETRGWLTR